MFRFSILTLLFTLLNAPGIYGGTTGKISGRVMDKGTGKELIGVNIVIKGLPLGAATDNEGHYFILRVQPGVYKVSATMIGYETQTKTEVRVSSDLTTVLDFELGEAAVEGKEVIVSVERPLIQKDVTGKGIIVEAKTFTEMPITTFENVLTTQAGFTTDENNEIHVRGGRTGEVAYLIDGIYVRDAYSGNFGSQLDKYSIKELQVVTGGYNAEYGQAMSGVVNIVTKEGGSEYRARFEYESLRLNNSPYRQVDWMLSSDLVDVADTTQYRDRLRWYDLITEDGDTVLSDNPTPDDQVGRSRYSAPDYGLKGSPEYIRTPGDISANLSGPIPTLKNLTFFVSGRYTNDEGYLPWGYDKRREVNGKLTYSLGRIKSNFFVQKNLREWKPYSHRWKYNPEGYEHRKSDVAREGIVFTHTLSNATFYEARFSRFQRQFDRFSPGKSALFVFNEATNSFELNSTEFVRSESISGSFYFKGDNGTIDDRNIETFTGKFDLIRQVNRQNLLKAGIEIIRHDISRETFIQPWEGDNHRYEKFERKPVELAIYAQDKLEHDYFIINAGLRFDYSDSKHTMWPDLDVPGFIDENGNWIASSEIEVETKTQLSPRLGIGFPVTDRTLFYSSYGHFYQIPSYLEMFGPHKADEDRPLIGNPAINPQKTVAFEAGVKQQLGEDYVLDVDFYFKDIVNLAGSTYHGFFPFEYTLYDNSDYGSVNGIDFTLTKRFSHGIGASLNYSYSVAKGNESDPREGFNDYKRANFPLRPKRLFFLDFDRRHDFSSNFNIILPKEISSKFSLFRPLEGMQFNILFQAASGLPYTPIIEESGEGRFRILKNSAHEPAIFNLDLKVLKRLEIDKISLTGFLVVNNMFDRRNVITVWRRTGLAWNNGPFTSLSKDRVHNPSNLSEPRRFSLGLRLDF